MATPFADVFWGKGDEFTGTYVGFEVLYQRLREGQSMSHGLVEVVTKRAQIERQYAESMLKLAETKNKDTLGDLKEGWDRLMIATKDIGQKHMDISKALQSDLGAKLRDFEQEQISTRKAAKKLYDDKFDKKERAYHHHQKTKKLSFKAYHDAQGAQEAATNAAGLNPKDAEKVKVRAEKAKISAEVTDMEHRHATLALDAAKEVWESEYEGVCKTFEDLERERVERLRRDMWTLANLGSMAATFDDTQNEMVRTALERVTVEKELQATVTARQTGRVRPSAIPYSSSSPLGTTLSKTLSHSSEATTATGAGSLSVRQQESWSSTGDGSVPATEATAAAVETLSTEATVPETAAPGKLYKALFSYAAQGPAELSFEQGEIITVLQTEEDPWYKGEVNGQTGMLYKEFLELV